MNHIGRLIFVWLFLTAVIDPLSAATLKENPVKLIAGGPAVRVTATGQDARKLSRFAVFRGNKSVATIIAIRRINVGSITTIELRANANATAATGYRLEGRTNDGRRILNARFSVVSKISTTLPKAGKANVKKSTKSAQVKTARTSVTPTLTAAPTVTSWQPRDKAHPGMVLVVNGQNLNQGNMSITLRSGSKSVGLQITRRSAARLEARIPDTAYTGRRGASLIVARSGSQPRTLTPTFQVLNRQSVYSGESLWHAPVDGSPSSATSIFTRGQVQISLDKFEFQESGRGTYSETTSLAKLTRNFRQTCDGNGKREVRVFRSKRARANRNISWRRLADGRIELSGIGLSHGKPLPNKVALATVNDRSMTLSYGLPAFRVETRKGTCCKPGLLLPQVCVTDTPLIPDLSSFVEWSLGRKDAL